MQSFQNDVALPYSAAHYFRHKGIKIRYKDIEDAIDACPFIKKSAVLSREDLEGNRQLTAYILPAGTFNQDSITCFLENKLQPFMMPAVWICINELPLTISGNIDRDALGDMQLAEVAAEMVFTAPRNQHEQALAAIVKEMLQLNTISIHDNFFRLGGTSLKALRVIAAIRKQFRVNIDTKHFFLYPTIAGMAMHLPNVHVPDDGDAKQVESVSNLQQPSLMTLKAGGGKIPLYIVCGGGGTAFTFEKFAGILDEDQPVYSFQPHYDIVAFDSFPETIEGMAAKYVDELLLVNPHGPYALTGHCIGGVIALEMAHLLQAKGKEIQLLSMFDVILTPQQENETTPETKAKKLIKYLKKSGYSLFQKVAFETYLLTHYTKDALAYKWEKIKPLLSGVCSFQPEDPEYLVYAKFEQKMIEAYARYKVNHFTGPMLVFYAKVNHRFVDVDRNIRYQQYRLPEETQNKWMKYGSQVKIFEVDGDHSSMFDPQYANRFAGLLQQYL